MHLNATKKHDIFWVIGRVTRSLHWDSQIMMIFFPLWYTPAASYLSCITFCVARRRHLLNFFIQFNEPHTSTRHLVSCSRVSHTFFFLFVWQCVYACYALFFLYMYILCMCASKTAHFLCCMYPILWSLIFKKKKKKNWIFTLQIFFHYFFIIILEVKFIFKEFFYK
jgi:hypothetical protein